MEANSKKVKRIEASNKKLEESLKKVKKESRAEADDNSKAIDKLKKTMKEDAKGVQKGC